MEELELRPMKPEHLDEVLRLAHEQGRNIHETEYARFLALEGGHGFVVVRDGDILGAVTVMRYFAHGFLGPTLVRAGADAAGLTVALAQFAVEALQRDGISHVRAEATEQEARLLEHIGFRRVRDTVVMERAPDASGDVGDTVPMAGHHLLDVGALDGAAAGHGRKGYLAALQADHPEGARVLEREGAVEGYVLMRRSRRGWYLGPLVTARDDAVAARSLVEDALTTADAGPTVALVPEDNALLPALKDAGFREVGRLVRMEAGSESDAEADAAAAEPVEWVIGGRITG